MNIFKTAFLMTLITVIMVGMGFVLGRLVGGPEAGMQAGMTGMTIALIFCFVFNFIMYWFSDKIVLMMYRAKEVSRQEAPDLYAIVEELTQRANLPMPRVYIINNESPNAFATGRNPSHAAVAATTGILDICNREEVRAVIAHELSHIKHRDILISTIVATIAGAIMWISMILRIGALFGGLGGRDNDRGNVLVMLAFAIVAPIAAMLIQLAISRSREYDADAGGALVSGDPLALASALRKLQGYSRVRPMQASPSTAHMFIVNPLSGKGMMSLFSTHPPVEERINRLQRMAR